MSTKTQHTPKGWNGTTLAAGMNCKLRQMGLRGCRAIIEEMNSTHAVVILTKGNKTWNAGDRTTVGVWWLEGGAL